MFTDKKTGPDIVPDIQRATLEAGGSTTTLPKLTGSKGGGLLLCDDFDAKSRLGLSVRERLPDSFCLVRLGPPFVLAAPGECARFAQSVRSLA